MTPAEFENMLENFTAALAVEMPIINEKMALNAYAMMKDRIINEGTIGEGKSLGTYSDNKLPAFYFTGKSTNKGADALLAKELDKENKGEGISYKEWRQANNRPVDHVTLSFTGTTLNDIGVVRRAAEVGLVITTVGPKNTKTRSNGKTTEEIAGYLADQYGDILAPSAEEKEILQRFLDKEFQKIISRFIK